MMEYLGERHLNEILGGTNLSRDKLEQDILEARNATYLNKYAQKDAVEVDKELYLPSMEKQKKLEEGAREVRALL